MEKKENKRHLIISGVSRGLGLSLANAALQSGYSVSGFSRRASTEVIDLKEKNPQNFFFQEADAAEPKQLHEFCEAACHQLGAPYGLVNNSAVAVDGVLATMPEIEIERMVRVDLQAPIVLTRSVVRRMLSTGTGGRIINISSIVGSRGYNGLTTYSACKAGLDGFSRSLARELGRRQITVNSVGPGYMKTEMSKGLGTEQAEQIIRRTPLGRLATLDDVVPVILFLLSDSAAFVTGQTWIVDGGITC